MVERKRKPSPVLGAAASLIDEASDAFVRDRAGFRHTFEAEVADVSPDPTQARKHFDDEQLHALAGTMAEQGQLQPILVRPAVGGLSRWIVVAGERRWRAAQINGWTKILAIIFNGDPEVASLLENLQRVDLRPIEQAEALRRLIDGKQWTQGRAAEALGMTQGHVSNLLNILTLPEEDLDKLAANPMLSTSTLIELARLPDEATRSRLVDQAASQGLTVKELRMSRRSGSDEHDNTTRGHRTFDFNVVARLTSRLVALRAMRPVVSDIDRDRLRGLRREIDALLSEGDK